MPDVEFTIKNPDLLHAIVCTTLSDSSEVLVRANEELPAGTKNGWFLAEELPEGAKSNPWPCDTKPDTHRHYLLVC